MRLRGFDITRAQRGWVCDCTFAVLTINQFTHEVHVVRGGGRWLLSAVLNAYRKARRRAQELGATPYERAAKGWN